MNFNITATARTAAIDTISNPTGYLGGNNGNTWLRIYSGEMPSTSVLAPMVNTNVPAAGVLMTFNLQAKSSTSGGVATFASISNVVATASGSATWFLIYNTNYNAIIAGDVTGIAGTGAIRLNDVNIVQGKTYGIQNFSFTVPLNYEF